MRKLGVSALLFSYNNYLDLERVISILKSKVDEIVVIDSSSNTHFENGTIKGNIKLFRTLPLGCVEFLRMYGVKKTTFQWVFYIDLDETPSNALLNDLHKLILSPSNAFFMRRDEGNFSTYQLRLFKADTVFYNGFIHEFPEITGKISFYVLNNICLCQGKIFFQLFLEIRV